MEDEEKRSNLLAILLIVLIVLIVAWFLWANFFGKGILNVTSEAPFEIQNEDGKTFSCEQSPCSLELKTGRQFITASKAGFDPIVESILIKAGKTIELNIDFKVDPYLLEAPNFDPSIIPRIGRNFSLEFDEAKQMQKLLDEEGSLVVYFPEPLNDAEIFASKNSAIILSSNGNYRIDVKGKTRKRLGDIYFSDGKWSPDGSYFLLENNGLWVMKPDNTYTKLDFNVALDSSSWSSDNRLIFFQPANQIYIYDAQSGGLEVIDYSGADGDPQPDSLYIDPNMESLYFTVGEKNYRLVLK